MFRSSRQKSSSRRIVRWNSAAIAAGRWIGNSGIISAQLASPARMSMSTWNFLDVGMQDLDDDLLAGVQPRPMDLADRSRGHRPRLELGETLLERPAEFALDDRCEPAPADRPARCPGVAGVPSASSTPTRSGRVLRSWPSLMNVGPSSARASRRRVSQGCRAMAVPPRALSKSLAKSGPSRPIQSASPYLLSTDEDFPPACEVSINLRYGADSHDRNRTDLPGTLDQPGDTHSDCLIPKDSTRTAAVGDALGAGRASSWANGLSRSPVPSKGYNSSPTGAAEEKLQLTEAGAFVILLLCSLSAMPASAGGPA